MKRISLITGGARSGKSSHAISLAQSIKGNRLYFIATGEALDVEMATRIAHHKVTRPTHFVTIEEALDPAIALAALESRADGVILDCLTLWVSNLMGIGAQDESILASADRLAGALARASFSSIIVTDEVGAGIVAGQSDRAPFSRSARMDQSENRCGRERRVPDGVRLSDAREIAIQRAAIVSITRTSTISPHAPMRSPVTPPSQRR